MAKRKKKSKGQNLKKKTTKAVKKKSSSSGSSAGSSAKKKVTKKKSAVKAKSKHKPKHKPKFKSKHESKVKKKLFVIKKETPKKVPWFKNLKKQILKFKTPIIVTASVVVFVVIVQLASFVITSGLVGKALPGTRIAGMDVGALTLDEIQQKLMEKGQPFLEASIPVTLEGKTMEFLPTELGVSLLPRHTLQDIHFVKTENTNLFTILQSMWDKKETPFYVSIDMKEATKSIENKFGFGNRKAKNAYLAFAEDELIIVPEQHGDVIDLRMLYQDIKQNAQKLSSETLMVTTKEQTPLVTQTHLEEEMETITAMLDRTISLTYETWDWDVRLMDHLDWVTFDYTNTLHIGDEFSFFVDLTEEGSFELPEHISIENALEIQIMEEPFIAYVHEIISPSLEVEAEDVSIYTGEDGEIIIEGKGENGREIKEAYFTTAVELAANNDIAEVPIPIYLKKAHATISDDLQMLGIETLIGTGHSAFAGSPGNRVHNIATGVYRFNGTLIEPGVEFSFNEHLGPVDASTGYKPELVIKAEGTIPEYGGGLCQVSSTMYRAALFAGLPIKERAPHSYAVSYYAQIYGYGLDATIYPGVRDIIFTNDTAGHILVQSYTEGTQAYFKFYGTDDGRSVEMEGPYLGGYHSPGPATIIESSSLAPGQRRQVEYGHTGFNATWYRHLTKSGETTKETIYSAYKAIPAKILVGPSVAPVEEGI